MWVSGLLLGPDFVACGIQTDSGVCAGNILCNGMQEMKWARTTIVCDGVGCRWFTALLIERSEEQRKPGRSVLYYQS